MAFPVKAHLHFVGIAGSGMSGIARIAIERGYLVTGSDSVGGAEELARLGAKIFHGHDRSHVDGADFVIRSSAISHDNPELIAAKDRLIPILERAQALAGLIEGSHSIAVTGTHGKTTTSSMLATALTYENYTPSFVVGSPIAHLGTSAFEGNSELFIIEADESDGSFLHYQPEGAIITNIELDHVDNFASLHSMKELFQKFIGTIKEFVVFSGFDENIQALNFPSDIKKVSYGYESSNDLQISSLVLDSLSSSANFSWRGQEIGRIKLQVPGQHNIENAAAAIAAGITVGRSPEQLLRSIELFRGTLRRFEKKGEVAGITLIDDYAHHPTEITATLTTARNMLSRAGKGRLIVIFQPHRYSRTNTFAKEFARTLADSDQIFLMEIYGASESPIEGVTSELISREIMGDKCRYISDRRELIEEVSRFARSGDLILTLGAGDVTELAPQVLEALSAK